MWISCFSTPSRSNSPARLAFGRFTLERHHRAEGRYPERLGDLVPRWLAAVPTHPQVREPWKYVRVGVGYRLHNTEASREPIDRVAPSPLNG